jgi:putative membrane protein (TIGR04086 family)
MQYDPRQTGSPPSPVEPTGFFTGIQIRPIIYGVVVDTLATMAPTSLYYTLYVAKDLADKGAASPDDAFAAYWASSDGLMASLLLGSLGTLIGGFYAAYKAGRLHMKHGALVGIGSIILGLILQAGGQSDSTLPDWFMGLSFAAAIPAGALGGFLAELFSGVSRATGSPPGSSWPGR